MSKQIDNLNCHNIITLVVVRQREWGRPGFCSGGNFVATRVRVQHENDRITPWR